MKLSTKIHQIKISDIIIMSGNPKNHPRHQIDELKKTIIRFGYSQPVLVSERNELIAGHGRLQAVTELGWSDVPAVVVEKITTAEARALRISDNRLGELGDINESALSMELADLMMKLDDGQWLDAMGFMTGELEELLAGYTADVEDLFGDDTDTDTDEAPKKTRVKEREAKQASVESGETEEEHGQDDEEELFTDQKSKKFKCPKCNLVSVIE